MSIFPLFSFSNSSHLARLAFGELSLLAGSNCGASSLSTCRSRAQFDPASTPSLVFHSWCALNPSSSCAISPVLRSPSSQSLAYPPLFPSSMIFVYSSIDPAYCSEYTNIMLKGNNGGYANDWLHDICEFVDRARVL